jgi:methylglutaconyl-CoA hydratase
MPQHVAVERTGAVLRLRLARPELHNAFDASLIADLTEALDSVGADASVRVVVLEAEGPSFSAGADLAWMRGMATASEAANRADAMLLARLMRTLDTLPKPTVARVQGPAIGGGAGLVACCDIAIGSPAARFAFSESRLGLLPAVISPYVVAAIGPHQARRWFATGEAFDAQVAARIGLLHELVPAQELDRAVDHQVQLLLRAGPVAAASAKALVRSTLSLHEPWQQDQANAALIADLRASEEGQEGLAAFLEKRLPAWAPGRD